MIKYIYTEDLIMKKLILLCIALLLCLSETPAVYANSAIQSWSGSASGGAVPADEDCPVIVTHEDLILHTGPLDENFVETSVKQASFEPFVEAIYTLKNPSDEEVTVRLAFPFGNIPQYFMGYGITSLNEDLYKIKVNGNDVNAALRYTYNPSAWNADPEESLSRLSDTYRTDPFYSPDLPVHEYQLTVSGLPEDGQDYRMEFTHDFSDGKSVLFMSINSIAFDGTVMTAGRSVKNGSSFTVYSAGEDIVKDLSFIFSDHAKETPAEGSVQVQFIESYSFADYAKNLTPKDLKISETDWYNSLVDMINSGYFGNYVLDSPMENRYLPALLMSWYDYTVVMKPGETVQNSVKAPLYPDIDQSYNPPVFTCNYLLTPAKTWKEFGDLTITVETGAILRTYDDKVFPFKETENGYVAELKELPSEDLSFELCAVKKPKRNSSYATIVAVFLGGFGLVFVILAVLVIKLVKKVIKKKSKR